MKTCVCHTNNILFSLIVRIDSQHCILYFPVLYAYLENFDEQKYRLFRSSVNKNVYNFGTIVLKSEHFYPPKYIPAIVKIGPILERA